MKEPSVRDLQISPNPTDALTTLSLELASAGILTLTLNDLQGRELLEIYSGFSDAGIFVKTFSMEVLPVGVYYLRVVHNGGVAVERIIKK